MPQQPKGRNPRVSKGAENNNPQCRVHDEVSDLEVEAIRQNVCVNDLPLTEQSREYLGFGKSFAYSLFVMTLQKPDPRPLSTVTYILYGLETIFAPVQAALLALAIRRKFMR